MESFLTRLGTHTFIYVVVPASVVGIRVVWHFLKQLNSDDWPIIQGKCTFAGVEENDNQIQLKVLYCYQLPTEKYPTCAAYYKDFFNRDDAQQWAKALHERDVPVHYNPRNPDKSNLSDSDLQSLVKQADFNMQGNQNSLPATFVR
jgi:hypothetical protein